MLLVQRVMTQQSVVARRAALSTAGAHLLARGVTAVGDMGWGLYGNGSDTWQDLEEVYDAAAADGCSLPLRCARAAPQQSCTASAALAP
jgi:predicted amidohydrolase YtcJ